MRKIAVAVDFSPESDLAARQAVAVARHIGAELVLVHAEPVVELPTIAGGPEARVREVQDALQAHLARELAAARQQLAELRSALSGQGPEVSQVLVEGVTDEALCAAARDLAADLLAVGTHGRSGLRWFFLGGIAQRVVRLAPVDVLVARREGSGRGGFARVLVATDFSPVSLRAVDRALELVAAHGLVEVVHCLQLLPAGWWTESALLYDAEVDRGMVDDLREQGEALLAARRRPGGPALTFELLREPPTPGIVHRLETRPFDLAVLGSHGRTGFRRAMLGSVAEAVVRRAPCSVLVARGRPPGET